MRNAARCILFARVRSRINARLSKGLNEIKVMASRANLGRALLGLSWKWQSYIGLYTQSQRGLSEWNVPAASLAALLLISG